MENCAAQLELQSYEFLFHLIGSAGFWITDTLPLIACLGERSSSAPLVMSAIRHFSCFCINPLPQQTRRKSHRVFICTSTPPNTSIASPTSSLVRLQPTPLTPLTFRGHTIYIKHDDLLHHCSVRGSKLRKFHSLFSPSILPSHSVLISYGGVQSNAMLALAQLCNNRRLPFYYVTRPIPRDLAEAPGNFTNALALGMNHIVISSEQFRADLIDVNPDQATDAAERAVSLAYPQALHGRSSLTVPQGGAFPLADPGLRELAHEIRMQITALRACGRFNHRKPVLFLASGTGTTAYYLAKHLEDCVRVVTVPVSGDERYLLRQMQRLAAWEGSTVALPGILRPRLRGSFADVRQEKLAIWREMGRAAETFEFDLVYAPKVWEEFMLALGEGRIAAEHANLIYYHSGGVEGNISMIDRFRRKGLWSDT